MEISGAIIVQVTKLNGMVEILGLDWQQNIHDRDSTLPFLQLDGVKDYEGVIRSLSFRRKPAGQHWFSYSHLLENKKVQVDDAHTFRLLLEIPIREELPFIDLIPTGILHIDGKHFHCFCLHTNAAVQPTAHDRMFFTIKPLTFLQSTSGLYEMVTAAIKKHGIE